jgi:hypothetical protein
MFITGLNIMSFLSSSSSSSYHLSSSSSSSSHPSSSSSSSSYPSSSHGSLSSPGVTANLSRLAVPKLNFGDMTQKILHFESIITSSRLGSPVSGGRLTKRALSRSESIPLPLETPKYPDDDYSPKRCHSMLPSFLSHPSESRDKQLKELQAIARTLNRFYEKVKFVRKTPTSLYDHNKFICSLNAFLFISSDTKLPSWRKLQKCPIRGNKIEYCQKRAQQTLYLLIDQIKTYINANKYFIEVEVETNGVKNIESIPLTYLLDRCLMNKNMLDVANKTELLRHSLAKCYISFKVRKLYHNCEAIVQTLNNFEEFSLFSRMQQLRTHVATNCKKAGSSQRKQNPILYWGYECLLAERSEIHFASLSKELLFNPSLVITHDKDRLIPPMECFAHCRNMAQAAIDTIQAEKKRIQAEKLQSGIDLETKFSENINLEAFERVTINFEYGFKGFIESSLFFISRHFNADLVEFEVDLPGYYKQLNEGITNPYTWNSLRSLLSRLDFLVSKIMKKNSIVEAAAAKSSFIGTPRKT